jgi:hypothetical protein
MIGKMPTKPKKNKKKKLLLLQELLTNTKLQEKLLTLFFKKLLINVLQVLALSKFVLMEMPKLKLNFLKYIPKKINVKKVLVSQPLSLAMKFADISLH